MRRILPKEWKTDIRVWRSVDIGFTRALVANNVLGVALMRIIYQLENAFPRASAQVGRYPVILIRKTAR